MRKDSLCIKELEIGESIALDPKYLQQVHYLDVISEERLDGDTRGTDNLNDPSDQSP